jgi:hypothetical protein
MDMGKTCERHQALQTGAADADQKTLSIFVWQFASQPSQGWGVHTNHADKTRKRVIYILSMFAFMHMSEQKAGIETHLNAALWLIS